MKKTYTINLSGKIFHIDEDAFEKLQTYITTLKNHYDKEEDGTEIMCDIENRIAELFSQFQKEQFREVINVEDVNQIISIMGRPNDIIDEEEPSAPSPLKPSRKLYRDTDKRILGGVAAGISNYFQVSIIFIRLLFVLLAFSYGISILAYLILWILIPKAKTTKEKLEMCGESINISNIERSIKETIQDIKESPFTLFLKRCGAILAKIIHIIDRILTTCFAIFLFFGSLTLFCFFIALLFLPNLMPWWERYNEFSCLISNTNLIIGKTAVFFLGGIPILALVFISIKLLFRFRSNNKMIFFTSLSVWFISLVMLIIVGFIELRTWNQDRVESSQRIYIDSPDRHITLKPTERFPVPKTHLNNPRKIIGYGSNYLLSKTEVHIIHSKEATTPYLDITYRSYNNLAQTSRKQNIDFQHKICNDTIIYDPYFRVKRPFRRERVILRLHLPDNFSASH